MTAVLTGDLQVNDGDDPIAALRRTKENYATSEGLLQKLNIDPGSECVDPRKKKASLDRIAEHGLARVVLSHKQLLRVVVERFRLKHPLSLDLVVTPCLLGCPRP